MRIILALLISSAAIAAQKKNYEYEVVTFKNQKLILKGELFKPKGNGPFPAIFYNHGSAPGMLNSKASAEIAPYFTERGWIFFMPYRRGQGLSSKAGSYIGDEIELAKEKGGKEAASKKMIELLTGDHFSDQFAGLDWLKKQTIIKKNKIAVMGNSFGGVETILGVTKEPFCAAVSASGGAQSWDDSQELQELLKESVRKAAAPIFFFQAQNDYDLTPTKVLSEEMKIAGKTAETKIYPAYGKTHQEGHGFAYLGVKIWFPDVFKFIEKHCQ